MTSEEPPKDEPQVEPAIVEPAVEPAHALDLDRARVLPGAARDLLRGGLHVEARPLLEKLTAMLDAAAAQRAPGATVIPIDRRKK